MTLHIQCDIDGCPATVDITHAINWPTPESKWGVDSERDYCPDHRHFSAQQAPARCSTCLHPITEHHHAMSHCTHRVGDAACVCLEYVP